VTYPGIDKDTVLRLRSNAIVLTSNRLLLKIYKKKVPQGQNKKKQKEIKQKENKTNEIKRNKKKNKKEIKPMK